MNKGSVIHAAGMVIGRSALPDWIPVFKDARTGKIAVQYIFGEIESCGLNKFDLLGLKVLTVIRYAEDNINRNKKAGEAEFHIDQVSETDEKTFDLFCRGDTDDVFQFESPGIKKLLKQVKPRCQEELIALNTLYRPGPMDFIPQYIERKWHPETIHYPDPCLEDILKETYGLMIYQEQIMLVAQRVTGCSLGEADLLRRAMGKKRLNVLKEKESKFVDGAVRQGFSKEHAEEIFEAMIPFAGLSFNKSQAVAYTILAYRTAWLKAHYPAEFEAAKIAIPSASAESM